ncbi:MAG: hypothetical protein HKM98_02295 [Gammaproteobacteria bacterium]|nr:hypothetical protein [Gammaproteobacteria bacterium]
MLQCSGEGGSASKAVSVTVMPEQGFSFVASQSSVDQGESVTLLWDATEFDSCRASGDWSGNKAVNGQEVVGPLQASSSFVLSCTGSAGTVEEVVNVSINGQASMDFSVDRTTIESGESANLLWSATSVDNCFASDGWSGSRATSGQESTGPLQNSTTFTLTCSAPGVSLSESVTVAVRQSNGSFSLQGAVDSSLVDNAGSNKVYVYAGDVIPDDYDGDAGDPIATIPVIQQQAACGWDYGLPDQVQDGTYTIAFTNDAANDTPGVNDTLQFSGATTVSVSGGIAVHDFPASSIIRVGPTRNYTSLAQASQVANSGDVVEIDAGTYVDDISVWRQDNVTLRGINGRAHMRADAIIPFQGGNDQKNGKGIIVTRGDNLRIENLEFSNASVPDRNGAGIRAEGGALTICNGYFHDNENGLLGSGSSVVIEYSEFSNNGNGDGLTHNIYIDGGQRFTFRSSYSHHARVGHNLKSRAAENFVLHSRVMDEATGNSSYVIDIPNGGLTYIIGNLIQQGPQAENSIAVRFGAEGLLGGRTHNLYIVNNSIVNDRQSGNFITIAAGALTSTVSNNIFVGNGSLINGPAVVSGNLQTSSPGFVDIDNYDYRLTGASAAIDAGVTPGSGDGFPLLPARQYVHPADAELRPQNGTVDAGAYEYSP